MFLQQLKLTFFKNYKSAAFDFSPQLNCLVGLNGMGKTNVLDAIYYLCMSKSNFGLIDANLVQHDNDFFRIEGTFQQEDKKEKIVAKIQPRKHKIFERNNIPYNRLVDHIGAFPVVMITPDDTILATEGSEERRRLLDNTLSQINPTYLHQLLIYNNILKNRNAALKQFAAEQTFNATLIETYNQQLLAPAAYLHEQRQHFMSLLRPFFQQLYGLISGDSETVDCIYASSLHERSMRENLDATLEKDRILQRTTSGIHKDDLVFYLNELPVKRFASQGQLKSFILAIKLAQYQVLKQQKNIEPILLLDDIFDKLDEKRVKHLVQLLLEHDFGQIFITDTHVKRIEIIIQHFNANYRKFVIENGCVVNDDYILG